jgi:hypothetical protein
MDPWRDRVAAPALATWDRLVEVARNASPHDGLPDGVGLPEVAGAVVAVAKGKGILRQRPGGAPDEVELSSRCPAPMHAVVAFLSGQVQAWAAAVREVEAAEPGAPGSPAASDRPARPDTLLQPLLSPQQAAALADRVRAVEAGVRRGDFQRRVFQPSGRRTAGIAWLPTGTEPPHGFNPYNAAEWGPAKGPRGFYLPVRALPDVMTALAILAGDFYIADGRDERGAVGTVGPMPGHESEFNRLNDLRLGLPVQMQDAMALLERWARGAIVEVQ